MVKHKEDRSDWVAVQPEFSNNSGIPPPVRPATTAYQFFQRENSHQIKAQPGDLGSFTRAISQKWHALDPVRKARYEELARDDQFRFRSESHLRDIAVAERQEKLRRERNEIVIVAEDGGRSTRSSRAAAANSSAASTKLTNGPKKKTKRVTNHSDDEDDFASEDESSVSLSVKSKGIKKKKKGAKSRSNNKDEFESEDESSVSTSDYGDEDSSSSSEEKSSDSQDSETAIFKKKKSPKFSKRKESKTPKSAVSAAVNAKRDKARQDREEKEEYIVRRQDDLRLERAAQAKKRLDFLLKQSDIFRHFGEVKEDRGKFQTNRQTTATRSEPSIPLGSTPGSSRRAATVAEYDPDELEQVDEHEATFLTSQPSTLGFGSMRPYQLSGLNWMIGLQENGVNGILADEMGLGKTLQSISILVYLLEYRGETGPHLVVVPKSTLSNWMAELGRWAPTLKAIRFHGTKQERDNLARDVLQPGQRDEERTWHLCVTTYEVCNMDKLVLNKFAWSYLIIDEAHRLKNEASTFSRTIRTFETRYRLLLTGTPLQNNLHELWALLNFLVPDVFASAEQFDDWFNLDIDDADEKNKLISQLHKILRPFMLRRLKVDVEKSLPPKHETILFTGMSVMQKKLYKDILMRDIDVLQSGGSGGGGNRTAILNIVMQLRKCAGHPYLFPGVEDRALPPLGEHLVENCGKMVLLDKLLMRLFELGHRVLLFTQMTRILDILEDYMVMRKFQYCRIDGNTDYEMREDSINAFNAPESEKFLFLLSTRAGGLGINLQTADVVILYDSDWNPQADLQAQDRAHRIGQKREVQVFRLVTEHSIEEKVVERAQQKLKLDAMVVQQGRLKDKDKLSRDELLEAVRFGADKVFKSKDSSITDDDIDMILAAGRQKTQELNEKLKTADKGDMLDFKLDGSGMSAQTFEGIDYSKQDFAQIKAAQAQAQLLGILDMGKRERRTVANYNEDQLYRQQISSSGERTQQRKKKDTKLPKYLRLPRLEEWQMFDRDALHNFQEEEELAFRALPEEQQNLAKGKPMIGDDELKVNSGLESKSDPAPPEIKGAIDVEALPPLLSDTQLAKKKLLLAEGFADWGRHHYSAFVKSSAKYGRKNYDKIAVEVGKPKSAVEAYAEAFWDEDIGMKRFSEHEYDRAVKSIERGEKKLQEIKELERGTKVLISLFDNPWLELEFIHVNCKDKMFTADEDRHLLCWAHKFGYGQWEAIKMAIRRSPSFRFDYYFRCLPTEALGRRCEQLMKAAKLDVEQMERKAREDAGMFTGEEVKDEISSAGASGDVTGCIESPELLPVVLPKFKYIKAMKRKQVQDEAAMEKRQLEEKVEEIEAQIEEIQNRLKVLQEYSKESGTKSSASSNDFPDDLLSDLANMVARSGPVGTMLIANEFALEHSTQTSKKVICTKIEEIAQKEKREEEGDTKAVWYLLPEYMNLLSVNTLRYLRKAKEERLEKKKSSRRRTTEVKSDLGDDDYHDNGFIGPDGDFVAFPEYDGSEEPKESKKAFTLFCNGTRRDVKANLDSASRKDKSKVNSILKNNWFSLSEDDRTVWKKWEVWDAKRFEHDMTIFEELQKKQKLKSSKVRDVSIDNSREEVKVESVTKKKRGDEAIINESDCLRAGAPQTMFHIPKKKKWS